jgi:hypothetical protein
MFLIFVVFLVFLVYIVLFSPYTSHKENYCVRQLKDNDKESMNEYVQTYPSTYSIDPLYSSNFKPECCPNLYTSSSGCLCIDKQNYSLLHTRGGNNYDFEYGTHKTPIPSFSKYTYS